MIFLKKDWIHSLLFVLAFIALCFFYAYQTTFFQAPQSLHIWRQTNGLSIAQMYYQYNLPFLQPEIQNQIADHGTTGKAVGEFPIIYYTIAKIWQVIGKSEWSFRLFQLLIMFAGFFALFRMLISITGNVLRAGFVSLLMFTSPMLIFYGPNFMPDGPALAFTFIAWYFTYKFISTHKDYFLWLSALFFYLAMSLKIITATSFLAITIWVIAAFLFKKPSLTLFRLRAKHFIPFILCLTATFSWYFYAYQYTKAHGVQFSIHGILPIWNLSRQQIIQTLDAINTIYLKEFFSPHLQLVSLVVYIYMLANFRKMHPFMVFLLIALPFGMFTIILLWFEVLRAHDYYLISQIQVMAVVWTSFFVLLKNTKFLAHPLTYILMFGVFALLVHDGSFRQGVRYEGWMNEGYKTKFEALSEIEPSFKQWNIQPNDKVISIPDYSLTASLYYMKRRGNTEFANDFTKDETVIKCIKNGAKYLIVNDTSKISLAFINKYASSYLGSYRNVKAYKLRLK